MKNNLDKILLALSVLVLCLMGCTTGTPTIAEVPTEIEPTATTKPSDTPAPSGGQLTGKLVWMTSGDPIQGAGIILCQVDGDTCQTAEDLSTITQDGGQFEFQDLDSGKYILLYNLNGATMQATDLELDLSEEALQCLAEGFFGPLSVSCQNQVPVFGGGEVTMLQNSKIGVSGSGFTIDEASLFSNLYGVYLDFTNGKPISTTIQDGETTETTIEAWEQ